MIYFLMSFNASYLSINILILVKNGIFFVISDIYSIFANEKDLMLRAYCL